MINVLSFVESECTPPRTHQLLQELRDLSSMAMEHFDEHILPRVKEHKEQLDEKRNGKKCKNTKNKTKTFLFFKYSWPPTPEVHKICAPTNPSSSNKSMIYKKSKDNTSHTNTTLRTSTKTLRN